MFKTSQHAAPSTDDTYQLFEPLWDDIESLDSFPHKRPLLAHYTSIATLERIMATNELWFSNPLLMNDMEELRFGILEGAKAFRNHPQLKEACGHRHSMLVDSFEGQLEHFGDNHALDTYVFCTSHHNIEDTDGLLSMWRGYGGNGNGAAIVFDTSQFGVTVHSGPMMLDYVTYLSQAERLQWIDKKLYDLARLLTVNSILDDHLWLAAYSFFERLKVFALFTKHRGFAEEQEWRAVYLRERDTNNMFANMLDYAMGRNGVEPKLKFKVRPIPGHSDEEFGLDKIVRQIILGPSVSSHLAVGSIKRMLEKNGKPKLAQKVTASTTPFRSVSA
jgi:hypothetical protein